jgi:hypothetical protein
MLHGRFVLIVRWWMVMVHSTAQEPNYFRNRKKYLEIRNFVVLLAYIEHE